MSSKRCNIDTSRRNAAPPWWPIAWSARLSALVLRIGSKRCGFLLLTCSHGCAGPGPTSCCDCSKRFPEGHSSARSWTATSHDMEGHIRRHRASRSADCLNDGQSSFRPTTTRERTGMKVKTVRAWVSDVPDEDAAAGWHARCALHPRSRHVRFAPKRTNGKTCR
jgi:hypothetical protein